ncbi:hypothetical protein ABKA04_000980 [Annulohypoxylon sp. FPYF3050]
MRQCVSCRRDLPRSSYTANQYSLGIGVSRCAGCVHGHRFDVPSARDINSGRYNLSSECNITDYALNNPFSEGTFRWVGRATYSSGHRNGQPCVIKWFKTGAVFEKDYFTLDIKAVDKALEIVNRFNELNIVSKTVKINVPAVWTIVETGQMVLCEPFIENYQKFNSNSGWVDDSITWGEVMQALSHFSYHISGGQFVLCDLQGGIYQREIVLSDPLILQPTSLQQLLPLKLDEALKTTSNIYSSPRHNYDEALGAHPSIATFRNLLGTFAMQSNRDYMA